MSSSIDIRQIHARLRKEYNSLATFTIPRLVSIYDERRKKRSINERIIYASANPVKSRAGNNWIIFIQKSSSVKNYVDKKSISVLAVTYHYCNEGLRAFYLADNNVIVGFNPHFFERYNERMQLNLQHPLDIVKAFFKKGIYCKTGLIKREGKKQPVAFRADGLQLGEYHVKNGYMEWRTFVNTDLIFPSQQRARHQIMKQHTINSKLTATDLPHAWQLSSQANYQAHNPRCS